ncbi:8753_t:CDS:1, partial [Funneliformis mosseae]
MAIIVRFLREVFKGMTIFVVHVISIYVTLYKTGFNLAEPGGKFEVLM